MFKSGKSIQNFENILAKIPTVSFKIDDSGRQSISHIYFCTDIDFNKILAKAKLLIDYNYWRIESEYLAGIYIESNKNSFLICMPKIYDTSLDFLHFNQSIDAKLSNELKLCGEQLNIPKLKELNFGTFVAVLELYSQVLASYFSLTPNQIECIKIRNTFKMILHNHRELFNNKKFQADSHLKAFSWIYFIELKIIADFFKGKNPIRLHDVATNTGNFPLLISALTKEELFNVNYCSIECSDIDTSLIEDRSTIISNYENDNPSDVSILKLDLYEDISILQKSDVIIANDILEHFNDEESFKILESLWKNTKKLLLIHVPIEEKPYAMFGHYTSFSKDKLRAWANKLPNCLNITDTYSNDINNIDSKYYREGFLCLHRLPVDNNHRIEY